RAPPGRARDRSRRTRLRPPRRGLRPACDLVPLPDRDGADLRPLPPPGADQHRAARPGPGGVEPWSPHPRPRRPPRRRVAARGGACRVRPRPARALPRHTGGPRRGGGLAPAARGNVEAMRLWERTRRWWKPAERRADDDHPNSWGRVDAEHEHDFRIRHVLETHNHADHLSGHGRLAAATGATLHVSAQAGAEHDHEPLEEGTALELGDARITAVRTPGHRPEHLAFVVEDRSREEVPWLLLTGDSLFVGDVARPDLAVEPEEGARGLHRSLDRLLEHEDFVEVWPGHVGGSLCGGAGMSEKPGSTIGFERRFNPLLRLDEDAFVRELVASPQPQPPNFELIVALNRGPLVTETVSLEPLAPAGAK